MTAYGYFLSCEEFTPAELLDQARRARDAGFTRLAISDHFHPWNDAQGSSPFVWSIIGALSQAVDLPVTTLVTCPTVRLHPVVTAQAAATSGVLLGGRFALGVGTGEVLNEHVHGDRWPSYAERADMLEEAGRRDAGAVHRLPGQPPRRPLHRRQRPPVHRARHPAADPRLRVRPEGRRARRAHRRRFRHHDPGRRPRLRLPRRRRGNGPVVGGVKVCWSSNRDKAVDTVHRLWPTEFLPGELAQLLPTPAHFEQASELVGRDAIAEAVTCGDDADEHVETVRAYQRAGFDEVYVGQVGPDQEVFFDAHHEPVLRALHG